MAITRGAVSGPTFAGDGINPLSSITLTLTAPMSGQVVVVVSGYHINGLSDSSKVNVTDSGGNVYTAGTFYTQPLLEHTPWYVVFFAVDLSLGTALGSGDTITANFTTGTNPVVAGIQASEYFGIDITSPGSGGSGHWRTFQQGSTTFSGFSFAPGAAGGGGLALAVMMRVPAGGGPVDPSGTFTPDDPTTGPPFLASGPAYSFLTSGDTGILPNAYRYYSYDVITTSIGAAQGGAWSPVVAFDNYIGVVIGFGELATGGVSLARSSAGHMFAAWQDRGFVSVARSLDQAFTWPLQKQIATDAAAGASPWLFIYRDDLFLIYHSAANFLTLYRLVGLLDAAPVLMLSAQPYQFPCAVLVRPGLMILAAYDLSSHLKVFSSPDFGVTLTLLKDYGVQTVERPALSMDRRGGLHLIYRTTANALMWDYCPTPSGLNWLGATLFQASGAFPGMSTGPFNGFVTWFGSAGFSELFISSLAPDCHSLGPLALPPAFTALTNSPGTWIDEHDEWWFLARQNSHSFGDPPPGSPPGDPGGGGAIIGGGGEGGFGGGLRVIESE